MGRGAWGGARGGWAGREAGEAMQRDEEGMNVEGKGGLVFWYGQEELTYSIEEGESGGVCGGEGSV